MDKQHSCTNLRFLTTSEEAIGLGDFLDSLFNSRLDEQQWYGSLIEKVLLVELWLEGFQGS